MWSTLKAQLQRLSLKTRQYGCRTLDFSNCEKMFVLLSVAITYGNSIEMPWSRWNWDEPQQPIAYFFRRHFDVMPIRSPNPKCECPPYKECAIDYKINEDAGHFLNLRGVLTRRGLKKYREEIEIEHFKEADRRRRARKSLRRNGEMECCCPPKNVYDPSYIIIDQKGARIANKSSEYGRR